jgi:hypothetical protein
MAVMTEKSAGDTTIRPLTIDIPEAELEDLRARLAGTRFPEKETVEDDSQGVPLSVMRDLARYWATDYDWRTCEARLNAVPTSSPKSTDWTSTSSTSAPSTTTRSHWSSATDGRDRYSSS